MKLFLLPLVGLALFLSLPTSAQTKPPKGEITHYTFSNSHIYPGTTRDYWIYIPQQYDAAKPACLLVDQDRIQFKTPQVLDELIADKEIPVTIAIFIQPGRVKSLSPNALDRFNRSVEYDGLGPDYVNFLITELLPDAESKTSSAGLPIHISHVANDRAIMGSSSGAIAAFTAAWERPDQFSRAFSAIGTYVNQRGGNIYPSLIRKFEPKSIRVFLQDGSTDHNIQGGNWWLANQEMESALTYAGYEVNHTWGTGDHDDKQATEILPDVLRYLWKDWPTPPKPGLGSAPLQQILFPNEPWQPAPANTPMSPSDRITAANGITYITTPTKLSLFTAAGRPRNLDTGLKFYKAITLSPDQSLLYAADYHSHWIYSYQIQPDGSLANKQKFYDLYVPDNADDAAPSALCVDRDGRLYVATNSGIQICDQAGRVLCILPINKTPITNLHFAGENLDSLYAQAGNKIFARKLKVRGVIPTNPPIKPAPPKL